MGRASARVVFDEDGDLRLIVGPNKTSFIVCSRALARASRVFKRMLFGGFVESKPAGDAEWVVELPEDDVNGLHILMDIIHGNIEKVSMNIQDNPCSSLQVKQDQDDYEDGDYEDGDYEDGDYEDDDYEDGGEDNDEYEEIDVDELGEKDDPEDDNSAMTECDAQQILLGVAVVADKYDLVHLLHPWANAWLYQGCRSFCSRITPGAHECIEDGWSGNVIWIAWVFGDEQLLQHMLELVVRSARLGEGDTPNWAGEGGVETAGDDQHGLSNKKTQDTRSELASLNAHGEYVFLYDPWSEEDQVLRILGSDMIERIEDTRLRLLRAMLEPVKAFYDKLLYHNLQCRLDGRQVTVSEYFIQLLLEEGIDILDDPETFRGNTGQFYDSVLFATGALTQCWPLLVIEDLKRNLDQINANQYSRRPLVPLSESVKVHLQCQRQKSKIRLYW